VLGDGRDELRREPAAGLEEVVLDLVEAVLVVAAIPATTSVSGVAAIAPSVCAEALVALGLETVRKLRTAFLHDTPVHENVHEIGLDVVEDPLGSA
jgi:hypothetical protein